MNPKIWLVLAGLLGAVGVSLGAYHAHGLEGWLEKQGLDSVEVAKRMHNCEVGVRYQMYHALALAAVAILAFQQKSTTSLTVAGVCFFLGVLIFSGLLYGIVFTGVKILGAIVPIGGVLLIVGWLALAWAAWRLA
ncbi:MAG: DUF423 domain-containing protein [Planctomycetes bacterium]|nr:DUF423 domain-containing protein [Planctomycetota bacterium]